MTKFLVFDNGGAYLGSLISASLEVAQLDAKKRWPRADAPLQLNEKWSVEKVDDFKRRLPRRRMAL